MLYRNSANRGVVKLIIIIVVALLVLSYFGYNLRSIVNDDNTKDNFSFVKEIIVNTWNNYLKRPATYIWGVFIDLIWEPAIDNLKKMKDGEPTVIDEASREIILPTASTT
jgi:hypothetical protein